MWLKPPRYEHVCESFDALEKDAQYTRLIRMALLFEKVRTLDESRLSRGDSLLLVATWCSMCVCVLIVLRQVQTCLSLFAHESYSSMCIYIIYIYIYLLLLIITIVDIVTIGAAISVMYIIYYMLVVYITYHRILYIIHYTLLYILYSIYFIV